MAKPRFRETYEEFQGRTGRQTRVIVWTVCGLGLLYFLALIPDWRSAMPMHGPTDMSHLKQVDVGLFMYASENDECFPLAVNWMDVTARYSKSEDVFHSLAIAPEHPKPSDPYGIAFRRSLASFSISDAKDPRQTAVVFDSSDLTRNASGELDLLPHPRRHGGEEGFNYVGFLDGHTQAVPQLGIVVK